MSQQLDSLIVEALTARRNAYAPYSDYFVGAAVLTSSGEIYRGCNVENGSYGATICAERTAIFSAVANGHREFQAVAVVTASGGTPCGPCRQVLAEFCKPDCPVVVAQADEVESATHYTVGELLPSAFSLIDALPLVVMRYNATEAVVQLGKLSREYLDQSRFDGLPTDSRNGDMALNLDQLNSLYESLSDSQDAPDDLVRSVRRLLDRMRVDR